jgi:8-oxo-dGTP diphosphatase
MKVIEVVAAIIVNNNFILTTKRGYGPFVDMWEFPGGKIELGESQEEALHREIMEELMIEIRIQEYFCTVDYDYPDFHLTMHCYICRMLSGTLTLLEHKDARWLSVDELDSVRWLPADTDIIQRLKNTVIS